MTREEAVIILKNEQPHCGKKLTFTEEERYEAYNLAIEELEEPKTGYWIGREASGTNFYGKCSCCGQEFQVDAWYTQNMNFCPNCGCRMESEE